jgi:phospholipid transport system substrate-binding protein
VSAVLQRGLLIIVVVLITPGVSSANPAAVSADPALFINNLDRQLRVVSSCASLEQRLTGFRELFREDFDVPSLSRFVLGRFLRILTPPEQQEFLGLFENFVVLTYSAKLLQYTDGGGGLRVVSSRPDADGVIVSTEIIREPSTFPIYAPRINPIRIDWRLSAREGIFKISDVVIDGLSMAANGRSQLEGVVERNGGRPQVILPVMRQQIASLSVR